MGSQERREKTKLGEADQASLNDMTLASGWGGKLMSVYMGTEGEEPAENIQAKGTAYAIDGIVSEVPGLHEIGEGSSMMLNKSTFEKSLEI